MSGNLMVSPPSNVSAIYLDDPQIGVLAIDPYADTGWTAERLTELARSLRERVALCRRDCEHALLRAQRKSSLEPWMNPLLERAFAEHPELPTLDRILVLAEDAERRNATLLFVAD